MIEGDIFIGMMDLIQVRGSAWKMAGLKTMARRDTSIEGMIPIIRRWEGGLEVLDIMWQGQGLIKIQFYILHEYSHAMDSVYLTWGKFFCDKNFRNAHGLAGKPRSGEKHGVGNVGLKQRWSLKTFDRPIVRYRV